MSPKALSRARRFAAGMSRRDIAREDGVTVGRVTSHLSRIHYPAGMLATPGSELPDGLRWMERHDDRAIARAGRWYVSSEGVTTREQVQWAVLLLDNPRQRSCTECGRPL